MCAVLIVVHRVISLLPGIPKGIYPEHNDAVAEEAKIGLDQALEYIETVLLKGPNQFLENAQEVSIADLSLVCEIKQLLVGFSYSISIRGFSISSFLHRVVVSFPIAMWFVARKSIKYYRCVQWLESGDQEDLLGSRPRIKAWVQAVENATNPEFNQVHSSLYAMAKKIQDGRKVAGQSSL